MSNTNSSKQSIDALIERMKSLKTNGPVRSKEEISLAAAVVLFEIASSDHVVDRLERNVIHNGLKALFKLSDETARGLMDRARSRLANMRGSSSEAAILRDSTDYSTKQAIAKVIDNLIRCNGVVDGVEIYLRKRFREILGISDASSDHFE